MCVSRSGLLLCRTMIRPQSPYKIFGIHVDNLTMRRFSWRRHSSVVSSDPVPFTSMDPPSSTCAISWRSTPEMAVSGTGTLCVERICKPRRLVWLPLRRHTIPSLFRCGAYRHSMMYFTKSGHTIVPSAWISAVLASGWNFRQELFSAYVQPER